MMYVFGAMWAMLAGNITGWFVYNASAGPKKDRLLLAIAWGAGMGIISFACAFS